jgi:hypothetical protein
VGSTESDQVDRAFPNIRFHVIWQHPPLSAAPPSDWKCGLHIHASLQTSDVHSIILSTLRRPQPKSGCPYVKFPDESDINAIVIHRSGSLSQSHKLPLHKIYRVNPSGGLSVRLEDGNWSDQRSLEMMKRILDFFNAVTSWTTVAATRGTSEPRIETVEIRFLDMHPSHLSKWLQFVSTNQRYLI